MAFNFKFALDPCGDFMKRRGSTSRTVCNEKG